MNVTDTVSFQIGVSLNVNINIVQVNTGLISGFEGGKKPQNIVLKNLTIFKVIKVKVLVVKTFLSLHIIP